MTVRRQGSLQERDRTKRQTIHEGTLIHFRYGRVFQNIAGIPALDVAPIFIHFVADFRGNFEPRRAI